jgi:CDP-paratose 2-epimerase
MMAVRRAASAVGREQDPRCRRRGSRRGGRADWLERQTRLGVQARDQRMPHEPSSLGSTGNNRSRMSIAVVSGSAGLIGSETCQRFHAEGFDVVGIDNDMRASFFGAGASTASTRERLCRTLKNYRHHDVDIRDMSALSALFGELGTEIEVVVHTAAQPSHDWAAGDPHTDFGVNANGTLNLLESVRRHCHEAVFIYTSTNKVYGDTPNALPLIESEDRYEIEPSHPYYSGIDELMTIDHSKHSLFGVSKAAADLLVQEYGRYFNMKTACFRGGCLTGPGHAGAELHGFLAYLMKCTVTGRPYRVFGYKGKQVRDNIHSFDLVNAFWEFFKAPRCGEVYNIGGGRHSNCSMLEAIRACQEISGRKLEWTYVDDNRIGDHIWWISSVAKFEQHYPQWTYRYSLQDILRDIHASLQSA